MKYIKALARTFSSKIGEIEVDTKTQNDQPKFKLVRKANNSILLIFLPIMTVLVLIQKTIERGKNMRPASETPDGFIFNMMKGSKHN